MPEILYWLLGKVKAHLITLRIPRFKRKEGGTFQEKNKLCDLDNIGYWMSLFWIFSLMEWHQTAYKNMMIDGATKFLIIPNLPLLFLHSIKNRVHILN